MGKVLQETYYIGIFHCKRSKKGIEPTKYTQLNKKLQTFLLSNHNRSKMIYVVFKTTSGI